MGQVFPAPPWVCIHSWKGASIIMFGISIFVSSLTSTKISFYLQTLTLMQWWWNLWPQGLSRLELWSNISSRQTAQLFESWKWYKGWNYLLYVTFITVCCSAHCTSRKAGDLVGQSWSGGLGRGVHRRELHHKSANLALEMVYAADKPSSFKNDPETNDWPAAQWKPHSFHSTFPEVFSHNDNLKIKDPPGVKKDFE